ncbi:group II truncated hemoglobin [Methylolobus aquaticus]
MNGTPAPSPYALLGGEAGLRDLVERFYGYMETLPEAAPIRAMHPADLAGSRDKLFKFLSGWLGGPNLYMEEFGHPRLRMRHFPFAIGSAEADQWLQCMGRALDETDVDPRFKQGLFEALARTAYHMINTPDEPPVQGP